MTYPNPPGSPNQQPFGHPAPPPWSQPPGSPFGPRPGTQPPGWNPQGPTDAQSSARKRAVLLGIIGLLAVSCVAFIALGAYLQAQDEKTYGALAAACDGRAVPGARALVAGAAPGSHRAVGFHRASGGGEWTVDNSLVPSGMRAQGVADAELVVCAGEETRTTLETCTYWETTRSRRVTRTQERNVPRTQAQLPVRVAAAATGAALVQGAVPGEMPRACGNYSGSQPSEGDYSGDAVGSNEVGAFLRSNGL